MTITLLYGGLLALLFLLLSVRVVQGRGKGKVSLGDGGQPELMRRIRGHANFAEYVPLQLLLLGLLELNGGLPVWALHVLGGALLVSRGLHGYAMSYTELWAFGRFYGTVISFSLLLIMGVLALVMGLRGL
jgi:uncharacterized membrane protein YecN with MAPEG domain